MIFIRVWPSGGISMLVASDRRSWPWWCAKVLSDKAKNPEQRMKNLDWAEWMAVHRTTGSRRHRVVGDIVRYFVNTCDICGKRGTHLSADSGRCWTHRLIADAHAEHARARRETKSDAIEEKLDSISRRVKRLPRTATPAMNVVWRPR